MKNLLMITLAAQSHNLKQLNNLTILQLTMNKI